MLDLRLAFRNLLARPSFSAVALLTLTLGIGANTAVFTVFNAVLLSPLPYARAAADRHPQRDVAAITERLGHALQLRRLAGPRAVVLGDGRVPPDQHDHHRQRRARAGAGEDDLGEPVAAARRRRSRRAADFPRATTSPAPKAWRSWARRSPSDRFPAASPLGQSILLDNRAYTIVGVMPASFELFQPAEFYVPFGPWAASAARGSRLASGHLSDRAA